MVRCTQSAAETSRYSSVPGTEPGGSQRSRLAGLPCPYLGHAPGAVAASGGGLLSPQRWHYSPSGPRAGVPLDPEAAMVTLAWPLLLVLLPLPWLLRRLTPARSG